MKSILFVFSIFILPMAIFGSSLDFFRPGEYAFYRDDRFATSYYRGYVITKSPEGRFTVVCRTINLQDKSENKFYFFMKDDEKGNPQLDGIGGNAKMDDDFLMQSMVDFLNFTVLYVSNKSKILLADSPIVDGWDNKVYDFGQIYPFFRFRSIKEPGKDSNCYVLDKAGVLSNETIMQFADISPDRIVETNRAAKVLTIQNSDSKTFKLGDYTIAADSRWYRNDSMGSPGLWFKLNTERDSQIMLETLSKTQIDSSYGSLGEFMHLIVLASRNIDFLSLSVSQIEPLEMTYSLYDIDNRNIKNITLIRILSEKTQYVIVNFSSFSDVYENNKAYYRKILDGFGQ